MLRQSSLMLTEEANITLKLVTKQHELDYAKEITKLYHGYKPSFSWVGRQINWLVVDNSLGPVGVIGIGSPGGLNFSKVIWEYIGIKGNNCVTDLNLNLIADNWRFTLCPWAKKNTASQALGLLNREAKTKWFEFYGDKLFLLITFVETPRNGTVYRAASWDYVGVSGKGKFRSKMAYGKAKCSEKGAWFEKTEDAKEKLIFAKPLHPYWRNAIIKNKGVCVG